MIMHFSLWGKYRENQLLASGLMARISGFHPGYPGSITRQKIGSHFRLPLGAVLSRSRWPKYWRFSFSISPSNEYSESIPLGLIGMISLLSKRVSSVFSSTIQKHQFFSTQPSLWSNSHICT